MVISMSLTEETKDLIRIFVHDTVQDTLREVREEREKDVSMLRLESEKDIITHAATCKVRQWGIALFALVAFVSTLLGSSISRVVEQLIVSSK